MTKIQTLISAIAALTLLPLSAYAAQNLDQTNPVQDSPEMGHLANRMKHGKRGHRGHRIDKLIQKLDLTPEQSTQVNTIQSESKQTAEALKQQMRSQHEKMKSLLASEANEAEIRAQYQEKQELHQQLSNNRFETMLRLREVLNTEQKAKFTQLMEEHRGGKHRN